MKVTITLTKQEAIDALLQFYKHTGASEIIISDDEQVEPDDGWISNVGWNSCGYPETLNSDTNVEVKFRNGQIYIGVTSYWGSSWKETDGSQYDIVAYRVLKD